MGVAYLIKLAISAQQAVVSAVLSGITGASFEDALRTAHSTASRRGCLMSEEHDVSRRCQIGSVATRSVLN